MNRYLDGLYFRVKRDGAYDNACFSDLSEAETVRVILQDWREKLMRKDERFKEN